MRIRANNLHLKPTGPAIICSLNQSPWDVISSTQLSENLQIIETDDRYFRELNSRSSPDERKSPVKSLPNHNQNAEKVAKLKIRRRKRQKVKVDANCDDNGIYDYYSGYGPNWKKRRCVLQNYREAANTSNLGKKDGNDDDDDDVNPLMKRSLKSVLDGV